MPPSAALDGASKLPAGWPRQHFNLERLVSITERAFFQITRQQGFDDYDKLVQDGLRAVWRQYDFIVLQEAEAGRSVCNPGGLMWRLLRGQVNRLRDDAPPHNEQTAPDLFTGVIRHGR